MNFFKPTIFVSPSAIRFLEPAEGCEGQRSCPFEPTPRRVSLRRLPSPLGSLRFPMAHVDRFDRSIPNPACGLQQPQVPIVPRAIHAHMKGALAAIFAFAWGGETPQRIVAATGLPSIADAAANRAARFRAVLSRL